MQDPKHNSNFGLAVGKPILGVHIFLVQAYELNEYFCVSHKESIQDELNNACEGKYFIPDKTQFPNDITIFLQIRCSTIREIQPW